MTNAEKYKDAIIAQECKTGSWAIDKDTNEMVTCENCAKCLFNSTYYNCSVTVVKWLNAEYREPKEFTDDERKVIELLDKVEWVAREGCGEAYIFGSMPYKENSRWYSDDSYCLRLALFTSLPFAAIKSTDTEPTSRAEILGMCVENERNFI